MAVEEAMEGHNLIIKLINCNSDSNHEQFCFVLRGQKYALLGGGGQILSLGGGGGNCPPPPPPRYIVKKGTAFVLKFELVYLPEMRVDMT